MTGRSGGAGQRPPANRRVADALEEHDVVVFLEATGDPPNCRFSRRALSLVDDHCEEYGTVDVGDDPGGYRDALRVRSGWTTVPQVFVDGRFVGDGGHLARLADRNELEHVLGGE